jgi:hypothetical protein
MVGIPETIFFDLSGGKCRADIHVNLIHRHVGERIHGVSPLFYERFCGVARLTPHCTELNEHNAFIVQLGVVELGEVPNQKFP